MRQRASRAGKELRHRTYVWNANDRLAKMMDGLSKGVVSYQHDDFGNLASAKYEDQQFDYKLPDEVGNLYRSKEQTDRKYAAGGQLLESNGQRFSYDQEGNLIHKTSAEGS
jgi:hypothetical protein